MSSSHASTSDDENNNFDDVLPPLIPPSDPIGVNADGVLDNDGDPNVLSILDISMNRNSSSSQV